MVPKPVSPPPGVFDLPTSSRFFLDLFVGKNAPISRACKELKIDQVTPLDSELGWNILNDHHFEQMLFAAWNGFVGGIWSAPPCREYSRLKLRPGGPPALRTPSEPYGKASLTAAQQHQLQEQEEIHSRGRQILNAAFNRGAIVGWETPPSAMTLLLTENTDMLRDWNATCAHVPACHWGVDLPKSWLLCSNEASIGDLAGWCTCSPKRPSFAGQTTSTGAFVSSETAEYPAQLAMAIAQRVTKKCTSHGLQIPWTQTLTRPPLPVSKKHLNDGGGIPSSADWSIPHKTDSFHELRNQLLQYGQENKLVDRVFAHLQQQNPDPPLQESELNPMKQITHAWAHRQGFTIDWTVPEGQRFRLFLLEQLAIWTKDPDLGLHHHLQQGVPTGVLQDIPPSNIWPKKPHSAGEPEPLKSFSENWQGANEDPNLTWCLINEEITQGWVAEVPGGLEQAKAQWPQIAVGKLNVVHSDGRKPRLVLDSSCCGVNPRCILPETMVLPTVDDVRAAFQPFDVGTSQTGFSLDIQAAHKQVRLLPQDQGLVMFSFQNRYFHYKVSHFGGRFSAFWWSRVGALLLRLLHHYIHFSHKAYLYVDDLFLLTHPNSIRELVWVSVAFLMLLGTPISWKKAQVGDYITWIGWKFDLRFLTVQLVPEKTQRLLDNILSLLTAKSVSAKKLEQLLGMLIWFTAVAKHLRPHLAPLYKCLYTPPATLFSIPAASWPSFVNTLNPQAVICLEHPHCILPLGGKVIEMGHTPITCRADLPLAPKTTKLQWVRIACPLQDEIVLTKEAKGKLRWFSQVIRRQCHIFPIPKPPLRIMRAAADAFAEGENFGIGGWLITSKKVCWFSEQFNMRDLRKYMPQLTKDAQKYIASFEILAQLVLLLSGIEHLQFNQMELSIPSASDNTAAESSINRSLSNKEPAATFLQLISQLAWQRNVSLQITHIPGQANQWADDLSRNRLTQWAHYPRFRVTLQRIFSIGRVITLVPAGDHPPWLSKLTEPLT